MEGRKLQLAGKSTFLVSLPKRWVTGAGLKAGDTLFVETESDGSVSIRSRATERPAVRRKIFLEKGEETREHLLRKLIGAYISGFGLVEVRFSPDRSPFVRRVAREFCHLVIGPEVIEESRNSIVIQDLSDPSELSSEKCLRRMHLTVRTMLEDALLAIKKGDEALARDVELRAGCQPTLLDDLQTVSPRACSVSERGRQNLGGDAPRTPSDRQANRPNRRARPENRSNVSGRWQG